MAVFVPIHIRFWEKVDKSGDCWLWTGGLNSKGYGQLKKSRARTMVFAHRLAWQLAEGGSIPAGMCVCHRCDNRRCVRIDHLFLGTNTDNMRDASRKGRTATGQRNGSHTRPDRRPTGARNGAYTKPHRVLAGERHGNCKLSDAAVASIRVDYASGVGACALARRHSVNRSTIHDIVTRTTRRSSTSGVLP